MTKNEKISQIENLAKANNGKIISSSIMEHFTNIVDLMDSIDAVRKGSEQVYGDDRKRYILDIYTLPNGSVIRAGYVG